MHKLESFALSANAKIDKPHIEKSFFPILEDKFICLSSSSNEPSKSYDHYDDVVFHLKPYLDKEGIDIVQIGSNGDPAIFYSKPYFNTNRLQNSYIISKSLLYLGNYNLYANIASSSKKKIVCPSNIDYVDSFFPYWSNSRNCKILTHNKDSNKPLSSPNEQVKTINHTYPEVIAAQVLDLLGIRHDLDKIETVFIGQDYHSRVMEVLPCDNYQPSQHMGNNLIVRMDKNFNEQALLSIAQNKKIKIITDKIINLQILKTISESISEIAYIIDNKTTKEEVSQLSLIGKPVNLVSKDHKNIDKIRLKFIDFDVLLLTKPSKSIAGIKKVTEDMKFLSRKNILSQGQIYNTYLSEAQKQNTSKVEDSELLWEDINLIRIFKEKA